MLVKFELNPNHPAPLHVKEWIRFQVLKKIDDFRYNILRTFNEDLTGPGLELLKFCFLAEFGRPVYETATGTTASGATYSYDRLVSYDNIIDAFDIPKEAFVEEYNKWIQWAGIINNRYPDNITQLRSNTATLMPQAVNPNTKVPVATGIAVQMQNNFFTVDKAVGTFSANGFFRPPATARGYVTALPNYIPVPDSIMNEWNIVTYPDAPKLLQLLTQTMAMAVNDSSFSIKSEYSTAAELVRGSWANRDYFLFNGTDTQYANFVNTVGGQRNAGTLPTLTLYIPTETSPDVWQTILRKVSYYNLPTRRFGTVKVFDRVVDSLYPGKKLDYTQVSKLNPTANLLMHPVLELPAEIANYFVIGQARLRNSVLMTDAYHNFDLLMIDYNDAITDQIDSFTIDQAAIDELIEDSKKGMFVHETVNGKLLSYFYEYGMKKPFLCPVTGTHISVQQYATEITYEAFLKVKKIVAATDEVAKLQLAKNNEALTAAREAYMRGEAMLKGPEALAEYERKLNSGVFYQQNGVTYWRPFTTDELKAFQYMKDQALKNKTIEDQNIQTAEANKLALEQVNAQVIASNDQKIKLATLQIENEFNAEMTAKANALVLPSMVQLIQRAKELSMNAPETLEQWIKEHPYIVYNPEKLARAEKLMEEVISLEAKVATAMVADTLSEARFTQALTELFKVG